jgi:hypothetical protein
MVSFSCIPLHHGQDSSAPWKIFPLTIDRIPLIIEEKKSTTARAVFYCNMDKIFTMDMVLVHHGPNFPHGHDSDVHLWTGFYDSPTELRTAGLRMTKLRTTTQLRKIQLRIGLNLEYDLTSKNPTSNDGTSKKTQHLKGLNYESKLRKVQLQKNFKPCIQI